MIRDEGRKSIRGTTLVVMASAMTALSVSAGAGEKSTRFRYPESLANTVSLLTVRNPVAPTKTTEITGRLFQLTALG